MSRPPAKPSRRRSRRQPDSSKPAVWDTREIRRLSESGVEGADIAQALGLVSRLASEPELRQQFETIVTRGHASFRVAVAKRMSSEAVDKGRPSALIEVSKAWLSRYADIALNPEEESGLVERVLAEMDRLDRLRANG